MHRNDSNLLRVYVTLTVSNRKWIQTLLAQAKQRQRFSTFHSFTMDNSICQPQNKTNPGKKKKTAPHDVASQPLDLCLFLVYRELALSNSEIHREESCRNLRSHSKHKQTKRKVAAQLQKIVILHFAIDTVETHFHSQNVLVAVQFLTTVSAIVCLAYGVRNSQLRWNSWLQFCNEVHTLASILGAVTVCVTISPRSKTKPKFRSTNGRMSGFAKMHSN